MTVTKLLTKFATSLWVTSNTASVVQWRHLAWKSPSATHVLCFCLTIVTEVTSVTSQFHARFFRTRRQLCSDDTWREKVLPQLTYCVSVWQSLLRINASLHIVFRDFMKSTFSLSQTLSFSLSLSLTVLTCCSLKSIILHPCFMHVYVLKLVVLFHCPASLNIKRAA